MSPVQGSWTPRHAARTPMPATYQGRAKAKAKAEQCDGSSAEFLCCCISEQFWTVLNLATSQLYTSKISKQSKNIMIELRPDTAELTMSIHVYPCLHLQCQTGPTFNSLGHVGLVVSISAADEFSSATPRSKASAKRPPQRVSRAQLGKSWSKPFENIQHHTTLSPWPNTIILFNQVESVEKSQLTLRKTLQALSCEICCESKIASSVLLLHLASAAS